MGNIKVSTNQVNETRHFATLSEAQLKTLIAEAVAKSAGVPLSDASVKVEDCYLTSRDTGTGIEREARCTIVVDHRPRPPVMPERVIDDVA